MKDTNHYCLPQSYRSREHLVSEFGNKVVTDRRILAKLLLEPFGVSLKMLKDFVIRCYEYGSHLQHQLPQMHSTTTLVRSSHEQYAICRKFDRSMVFQSASSGSFRVDQGLHLSALYTSGSLLKTSYTLDNYSS